jgi:pantoate--beta-alanine ligase
MTERAMPVIATPAEMQRWSDEARLAARTVVLVPTMGALHDGHIRLLHAARAHGDLVVASIFVNPLQFNVRADFDAYPRPIDDDVAQCAAAGVDAVYAPTAAAMYPDGFQTHVEPGDLAATLEGAHRPGHFRGVATVVTKLFLAVRPQAAVFGEKDFQQLAIVRRMTADLDIGIRIVSAPTVREPDGLAMSSRNRRLDPADRAAAVCISRGLLAARSLYGAGERRGGVLAAAGRATIEAEPRARLEYLAIVHPDTLAEIDPATGGVMVVAAWFGDVRLIDNIRLDAGEPATGAS